MRVFGRDLWLTGFDIVTDERLVIIEDLSPNPAEQIVVELPGGRYFQAGDASFHGTELPDGTEALCLWTALITTLNAGTSALGTRTGAPSNGYQIEVVNPSVSDGYVNGGLRLYTTSGHFPFHVEFSGSPATTIDPRLFGLKDSAHAVDVASSENNGVEEIIFPNALRHRLVTHTLNPRGAALSKHKDPYIDARYSSSKMRDSIPPIVHDEGYTRRFFYPLVPGGFVYETRCDELAFCTAINMEQGDRNASWEVVFRALVEGEDVIIVHNASDDFEIDTHGFEIVRLNQPLQSLSQMATPARAGGDYHNVDVTVVVHDDLSSYPH